MLVNNAGIGNPPLPIINMPEEAWDRTIAVNLKSVFLCSKAAANQFIAQGGGGRIVSVASQAGKTGYRDADAVLRVEGRHRPVHAGVREGSRGAADHRQLRLPRDDRYAAAARRHRERRRGGAIKFEDVAGKILPAIPLGRVGYPADVAKVITFLASDEADYMTGQAINITGGQEMH